MLAVLGIDTAWTAAHPSGVALIEQTAVGWSAVAVAPSYAAFVDVAAGRPVDWAAKPIGGLPDVAGLLDAGRVLLGGRSIACVAVDMPLATVPITGRRVADNRVSQTFGKAKCSTHSPNPERPGQVSWRLRDGFAIEGFPLATATTPVGTPDRLLEVYPGPAILRLLNIDERLPYKLSRARRYWPHATPLERRQSLLDSWHSIRAALGLRIAGLDGCLPDPTPLRTIAALKGYEDALDALVCTWVGTRYLAGTAGAYGDETGAIWIPS